MHQGSYIVEVDGIKSLVVTLSALFKVIIHKSCGLHKSPVEQDTIECVSTAYFDNKNVKKVPSKVANNIA